MKKYYLLSLKWSIENHFVWWLPDNNGYTHNLDQAGIYTEEQINSDKNYYSNTHTMPVPVELLDEAITQRVATHCSQNHKLFGIYEHLKTAKEI